MKTNSFYLLMSIIANFAILITILLMNVINLNFVMKHIHNFSITIIVFSISAMLFIVFHKTKSLGTKTQNIFKIRFLIITLVFSLIYLIFAILIIVRNGLQLNIYYLHLISSLSLSFFLILTLNKNDLKNK